MSAEVYHRYDTDRHTMATSLSILIETRICARFGNDCNCMKVVVSGRMDLNHRPPELEQVKI